MTIDPRHRAWAAALTLLIGGSIAVAHPGISLGLKIHITDEKVQLETVLSADFIRMKAAEKQLELVKPTYRDGAYRFDSEAQEGQAVAALLELVRGAAEVSIDGIGVPPVVQQTTFVEPFNPGGLDPGMFPPDGKIVLDFPSKGKARAVAVAWHLYPEDPMRRTFGLPPQVEIVAELDAYDENRLVVFSFDEPQVIWHAPTAPPGQRVWPVLSTAEPKTVNIPIFGVATAAVWLTAVALSFGPWRRRRGVVLATGIVPVALIVGTLQGPSWVLWRVAVPGAKQAAPPSSEEARQILETLQRNIYRAFDYKTESDVYDVLAKSVDGPLLDDVYNEVHQSLILRDQGGAMARIEQVDVLNTDVLDTGRLPDGRVAVQLMSNWQVLGAVAHWGHVHRRTNEYSALYTVASGGDVWKVTAVQVVSQKRVIKEGDDPLPPIAVESGPS